MPTPVSGNAAYCTVAQFLESYDSRSVAELLSDNNTPVDSGALTSNATLAKLLKQASGKVEAAALLGGMYTPEDLAALNNNQAEFLAGLVADITIGLLLQRRMDAEIPVPPQCDEADEVLNALAEGKRVFGLQAQIDAGHMTDVIETPEDVRNRNMATYEARRLFGRRGNRKAVN